MKNRNHNHYICEVKDTLNPKDSPIYSYYHDGTQAQAIDALKRDPKIKKYLGNDRYSVVMRGNSITLDWDWQATGKRAGYES